MLSGLGLDNRQGTRLPDLVSGAFGPTWIRLCITVNHPTERTIGRGGRIKTWGVYIRDLAKSVVDRPGVGGTFFLFTKVLAVPDDSRLDASFALFFLFFFPLLVGVFVCPRIPILDTSFGVFLFCLRTRKGLRFSLPADVCVLCCLYGWVHHELYAPGPVHTTRSI